MKKVTLFLAVLIFTTSLSSCYDEDFISPIEAVALLPALIIVFALSGKVTQELPEVIAPEVYKLNEDFNVNYSDDVLTIKSSFVQGGQLHIEAVERQEDSNWIIKDARIETIKALNKRFELDKTDPTSIAIQNFNYLTNEIELSFDIVIQDLIEQQSIPMRVSFGGTYN